AGPRVDRRLTNRERQARPGYRADTLAGGKANARSWIRPRYVGDDKRAMRNVGVVAGVLDDAGATTAFAQFGEPQREGRRCTARQADRDRVGESAGQQRGKGRARGSSRTGAGRPAAAQRSDLLPCHMPILAKPAEMTTLWPLALWSLVFLWVDHMIDSALLDL